MNKCPKELRGLRAYLIALIIGIIVMMGAGDGIDESEDFMSIEEFSSLTGDTIKFRYGVTCLCVEVPFQEGEKEKMMAVGKLIEAMLRELKIIKPIPSICPWPFAGLPHWVYGECYGCGAVKMFGGLCEKCDGVCPGCGVKRIQGRACDECKEKGIIS